MANILVTIIFLPIFTCVSLRAISSEIKQNIVKIKKFRLLTIVITFAIRIYLWCNFDSSNHEYQFSSNFLNRNLMNFHLSIDGISLFFVCLTTFIIPVALLSNWKNINDNIKIFLITFLILERLLLLTFVVVDILLFYVFFESVLIPLFLIVGI